MGQVVPSRSGRYELRDEGRTLLRIVFVGINFHIISHETMNFGKLAARKANVPVTSILLSPFQCLKRTFYRHIDHPKRFKQRLEYLLVRLVGHSVNDHFVAAVNQSRYGMIETREEFWSGRRTKFLITQLAGGKHNSERIQSNMKINLFHLVLQCFRERRFA